MDFNVTYREKDKGIQAIISYKTDDGWKTKSKQGFKTQKEAKPWVNNMLDELQTKLKVDLNEEYQGITLSKFIDIYLEDLELRCEYNTARTIKAAFKKLKKLDDIPMSEIEYINIQRCVNGMVKEGLKISTIKEYVTKISTFFNDAIDPYKVITTNPAKGVRYPKLDKEVTQVKVKALTKSELDYVLNKVSAKKRDYITILLASSCGLRVGELAGLTYGKVDFKNKTITINQQWKKDKDGKYGFGKLKTKNSYRTIPVPTTIIDELDKYKNTMPTDRFNRILIDDQTANVSTRIRLRFKTLGMDNSIHDLRHTYVTMLIANGVDFKTISQLIGDTVEMVLKTYSHVNDDMMENAKSTLNQIFG